MIRAALLLFVVLALPGAASAADMAVFVKNGQSASVAVELHGRSSVWPGGDKVWEIEAGMKKSIPIQCEAGERLCYAAWVSGAASTNFGVGPDNDRVCEACCVLCVAKSTMTIDIPAGPAD